MKNVEIIIEHLPLTTFQKEVLRVVAGIPHGQTRTYKWVAEQLGRPHSARAVGRALSRNPLPMIISCHRVVRSDGKTGGYRWGEALKRRLIESERGLVDSK